MLLLYRQSHPTTALILAGDDYTLKFEKPTSTSNSTASPQIQLSFSPIDEFDVLGCNLITQVHSSLGLVQLASPSPEYGTESNDIYLAVISNAQSLTSRCNPQEQVYRINNVDFYSVTSTYWDTATSNAAATTTSDGYHHQGSGTSTPTNTYGGNTSSSSTSYNTLPNDGPASQSPIIQHPATSMKKILSNGHFYFSKGNYDISTNLQERLRRRDEQTSTSSSLSSSPPASYDSRFVWNSFLMDSLLDFKRDSLKNHIERESFDKNGFIVNAIQGFVGIQDFTLSGNPVSLQIFSRLGSARAGTRFNARGIDDDGNVANFVETETIFRTRDSVFSFVQVRGSVPLFWEQQGTTPFGGQKLQITRPPIASQPAFNKHFSSLMASYPNFIIQAVNLLSTKDHEALLSNAYREHVRNANAQIFELRDDNNSNNLVDFSSSNEKDKKNNTTISTSKDIAGPSEIGYTEFDFHSKVKLAGGIESVRDNVKKDYDTGGKIHDFGYCLATVSYFPKETAIDGGRRSNREKQHMEEDQYESLLTRQEGIFRTNCLDCLDRTNVVQDILSRLTLEHYLHNLVPSWSSNEILLSAHRTLWAENGDALSRIYAGTGALNTSFTRSGKRTFAGALSDATKSVSRMYISNFVDKGKQSAIDALLGNLAGQQKVVVVDPVRDSVESALRHRESEYSSSKNYMLFCGTYNVNGKSPGQESFLPWLFPDTGYEPDIIALGFQELVELSPQQIMATDPEKLRRWTAFITKEIAERPKAKSEYVLLRSEQLVGTCIIIFMKNDIAHNIKNVEAATKKTGLKGMAGNKGAVAVRLDFNDTSICFVTAHFAAGHSNFEQRNMDYATIANGLQFRRGRQIAAHDNIIYFGDLNYRIGLSNEDVRYMASIDDFTGLIEGDQLTKAMKEHAVFSEYREGPLIFRPTYKYDNGSDVYDSSEKQRIPAWTDRILYNGAGLELFRYDRAELLTSDHRPVYALIRASVKVIDHEKKEAIAREILRQLAPEKAGNKTILQNAVQDLMSDEETGNFPAASTEQNAWWSELDTAAIKQQVELNEKRRNTLVTNPFDEDYTLPSTTSTHKAFNTPTVQVSKSATIKRKPPPSVPSKLGGAPPSNNNDKVEESQEPLSVKARAASLASMNSNGNTPHTISSNANNSKLPMTPSDTPRPSMQRKNSSNSSLLDGDNEEPSRPQMKNREATTEWQIITPTLLKR